MMADLTTIVRQAIKGDKSAFSELVSRHRGLVYAICLSQVGQATEAQDLTQEVFVRVHRDLTDLREPEKLLPWLRSVARNVCRMRLRRRRTAPVPLEAISELADPKAAARLRQSELGDIVNDMLTQVSSKSREALALHYLAGCSEAEIAAILGLSRATVKSRLREGRGQAKRKLLPVVKELLSLQGSSEEMVEQIMAKCDSPGCVCPDTLTERR
jgi:RNA polymerase sigma-70 factor (ECF subfamily)